MTGPNSERLEHILQLMREDTATDAPADALKFAKDVFRTRVTRKEPSAIRRFVAALSMELAPNKPAFGERSGSASAARQLLFEAGDAAIDLRIERIGKSFSIRGQVLGIDLTGGTAVLSNDGGSFDESITDGQFHFRSLPDGEYWLTLGNESEEIVINAILVK